jgi:hypothetical protein
MPHINQNSCKTLYKSSEKLINRTRSGHYMITQEGRFNYTPKENKYTLGLSFENLENSFEKAIQTLKERFRLYFETDENIKINRGRTNIGYIRIIEWPNKSFLFLSIRGSNTTKTLMEKLQELEDIEPKTQEALDALFSTN